MALYDKKWENMFMKVLLEYAEADLSALYVRKNNFACGKSLDYCKIGKLKFNRKHHVVELGNPDSAFRLGLEFGINIGIDAFNSVSSKHAHKVSETLLPKKMKNKLKVSRKSSKV